MIAALAVKLEKYSVLINSVVKSNCICRCCFQKLSVSVSNSRRFWFGFTSLNLKTATFSPHLFLLFSLYDVSSVVNADFILSKYFSFDSNSDENWVNYFIRF